MHREVERRLLIVGFVRKELPEIPDGFRRVPPRKIEVGQQHIRRRMVGIMTERRPRRGNHFLFSAHFQVCASHQLMGVRVGGVNANGTFKVPQRPPGVIHQLQIYAPQSVPRRNERRIPDQGVSETRARALRILRLQIEHSDPYLQQRRVGICFQSAFQLSDRQPDRIGMVRFHAADVDAVDFTGRQRVGPGRCRPPSINGKDQNRQKTKAHQTRAVIFNK